MRLVIVTLGLATLAAAPAPADACSIFANETFTVEPGHGGDTTPPSAVNVAASSVTCHRSDDMCGFEAVLSLSVSATDDASPVGFRVRAVVGSYEGTPPADVVVPGVLGELAFYDFDRDPAYELEVTAVDLAGNEGPTTRVALTTPDCGGGDDDGGGGCSTGGGGALGGALALLGLVRARRRAR